MRTRLVMLAVLAAALLPSLAAAQIDTLWTRTWDGTAHDYDNGTAVVTDRSGNSYVAGYTTMAGSGADFLVIKYRPDGDTAWVRLYNGPDNGDDVVVSMALDPAGNVYVTGLSQTSASGYDFLTMKYDSTGNERWAARYNPYPDSSYQPTRVRLDRLGNVYVSGCCPDPGAGLDYVTVKYDSSGDTVWTRRFDDTSHYDDYMMDLAVDSAGNAYLTGGASDPSGDEEFTTIKYDPAGNLAWSAIGPIGQGNGVVVGTQGHVYAVGVIATPADAGDYAVIAYDAATGDTLWTFACDGPAHDNDEARTAAVGPDGSIYVTGYSTRDTVNWNSDWLTVRLMANGDTAWVRRHLGPYPGGVDYADAIAADSEGNAYVTGRGVDSANTNTVATARYDLDGTEQWYARYSPDSASGEGTSVAALGPDAVFITGGCYYAGRVMDCTTIKYGHLGAVEETPNAEVRTANMPTIVRGVLRLDESWVKGHESWVLVDASGRRVLSGTLEPLNPRTLTLDVSVLSPGVYFVRMASGVQPTASRVAKVVVTR